MYQPQALSAHFNEAALGAAFELGRSGLQEGGDGGGGEGEGLRVAREVPQLERRGEVVAARHGPPRPRAGEHAGEHLHLPKMTSITRTLPRLTCFPEKCLAPAFLGERRAKAMGRLVD